MIIKEEIEKDDSVTIDLVVERIALSIVHSEVHRELKERVKEKVEQRLSLIPNNTFKYMRVKEYYAHNGFEWTMKHFDDAYKVAAFWYIFKKGIRWYPYCEDDEYKYQDGNRFYAKNPNWHKGYSEEFLGRLLAQDKAGYYDARYWDPRDFSGNEEGAIMKALKDGEGDLWGF